jgi:hypothetical protein
MNRITATGLVGLLVTSVGIVGVVRAQEIGAQGGGTPPSPKEPKLVTVRGCVRGSILTTAFQPRQFQLSSSRELSAILKKHSGHTEEITGRLKSGDVAGATVIKEKSGSQGRVYVGVGKDRVKDTLAAPEGLNLPVIEVRSVTHIENSCSGSPGQR